MRRLAPGVAELKRMWLRPACRGRGLADRLMARVLEEARALGGATLRLDSESRLEAAVRLYRRYGFREIADYNGNPRADVWMELPLRAGTELGASSTPARPATLAYRGMVTSPALARLPGRRRRRCTPAAPRSTRPSPPPRCSRWSTRT